MDQLEKLKLEPWRAAVASYEGLLVNQHLGMADVLWIFEVKSDRAVLIEKRRTPRSGGGQERWQTLAGVVSDCRFLLCDSAGQPPVEALAARGIKVIEVEGLIEDALDLLAHNRLPPRAIGRPSCRCSESAAAGQGCA